MNEVFKYFPELEETPFRERIAALGDLYRDWNSKINVISRKDIDNLYTHHVLHALSILKFIRFKEGALVCDLGTGGGFPGIPLAIALPDTQFVLIDGTRKKLRVVEAVKEALQLDNVAVLHQRAEEIKFKMDFVVCRAVATVDKLMEWSRPILSQEHRHAIPNGLITLKGGDPRKERKLLKRHEYVEFEMLDQYFEEPYFEEKYLMYVQG